MSRIKKQLLDGNIETFVMAILQDSPSYGYQIVKELNERAKGILQLGEGTVYPILHRLEEKKLLCSYWSNSKDGRQRKYYRLSAKGKKKLAENHRQWQLLAEIFAEFIGSSGKLQPDLIRR